MQVCKQLKNLRCSLNLSQDRFGKRIGISGKSVSAYETGRCMPTVKVLSQIANEFKVCFIEIPTDNRMHLQDKLDNLENSFDELRRIIDDIINGNR